MIELKERYGKYRLEITQKEIGPKIEHITQWYVTILNDKDERITPFILNHQFVKMAKKWNEKTFIGDCTKDEVNQIRSFLSRTTGDFDDVEIPEESKPTLSLNLLAKIRIKKEVI